jgi:hypothetical protein
MRKTSADSRIYAEGKEVKLVWKILPEVIKPRLPDETPTMLFIVFSCGNPRNLRIPTA